VASAAELQQRAIEFARRADFGAEALEINRELTSLDVRNEGAWTRLGRCCLEQSLYDDAAAAADAALALNPQNTIARNLHAEIVRRRTGVPAGPPARAPRSSARKGAASFSGRKEAAPFSAGKGPGTGTGIGRAEFAALGELPPEVAIEAIGPRLEAILMALNDRPFARKAVETRNRAGSAGDWLFRRNTIAPGPPGHVFAFHHGGRWEPQFNIGLFAARQWGRDALRAGIGFNLSANGDADGRERALAHFAQFQQLIAAGWRKLLADWMAANGGFVQLGDTQPAAALRPDEGLSTLVNLQHPAETGWVFAGGWLFADRADHAEILRHQRSLVAWLDDAFAALLPLWTTLMRDAR
jgi:tetratricopeptide (TPR) repeat protein